MAAVLISGQNLFAQPPGGGMDVKLTPAVREFCHVIRFSQGWNLPRFDEYGAPLRFDGASYEFRVEGVLGTHALVGQFKRLGVSRYETTNRYKVDLSNPRVPARPSTREEWGAAMVVALSRKSVVEYRVDTLMPDHDIEFKSLKLSKSGFQWAYPKIHATRLSPDSTWLVLQSWTRDPKYPDNRGDEQGREHGKVFLDVFNTEPVEKLLTIEGTYSMYLDSGHPNDLLGQTAWFTEKYFIVPLGTRNERCLVCDFNRRTPGAKP